MALKSQAPRHQAVLTPLCWDVRVCGSGQARAVSADWVRGSTEEAAEALRGDHPTGGTADRRAKGRTTGPPSRQSRSQQRMFERNCGGLVKEVSPGSFPEAKGQFLIKRVANGVRCRKWSEEEKPGKGSWLSASI